MKRIMVLTLSAIFTCIALCACSADTPSERNDGTETIQIALPANGASVSLNNKTVSAFLKNYMIGSSADVSASSKESYYPEPVSVVWNDCGAESYVVRVSEREDFSVYAEKVTDEPTVKLNDLTVGTKYYLRVKSSDGKFASGVYTFTTKREPRTVFVEGVSNTRDIGGYAAGDSFVRQKAVYRGANPDSAGEAAVARLKEFGIKTVIDLREAKSRKKILSDVTYVDLPDCGSANYVDGERGLVNSEYREALIRAIKVFADEKNYPVYFHCQIGRDRTGTLAFVLNGLLGVEFGDLATDYEISFFSVAGCLDFKPDKDVKKDVLGRLYRLNEYFMQYSKKSGEEPDLKRGIENFLKDNGVTETEIFNVRKIMLLK